METDEQGVSEEGTGVEGEGTAPETTQGSDDMTQQSSPDDSSEGGDETVFEIDGRKVTASELYENRQNLQKDYTRTTQQLKELKAEVERMRSTGVRTPEERVQETAQDLGVPEDVAQTLDKYYQKRFAPQIKQTMQDELSRREELSKINQRFDELGSEWDGKDGKPKYRQEDREELVEKMRQPGAKIFDPKILWEFEHRDEIRDWDRKRALKQSKGTPPTEKTGSGQKKPKRKSPKSLEEAGEAFYERLGNL